MAGGPAGRPGRFAPGPTWRPYTGGPALTLTCRPGPKRPGRTRLAYFARWRIGGLHTGQGQWSCAAFSTVIAVAPVFRRLQPDW
jgi:hypothetical protein